MNNRNLERNLQLFFSFYSNKLRDIIGPLNGYLEFEKKLLWRRVDIFFEEENHDILIELQINDSDETHLNQILEIIQDYDIFDDTKIIWVATDFHPDHLREVRRVLRKRRDRRLDFLALKISNEMVTKLEAYSNVDDFSIIEELSSFVVHDDTELVVKYSNKDLIKNRKYSYKRLADKNEQLIRFFIKEIRNTIPEWTNAYNAKTLSARRICFGGAAHDITFKIGITAKDTLSVDVQFGQRQFDFFWNLYICEDIINKKLDPKPKWEFKKHKISNEIPYLEEKKDEILRKQVSVLKTYLEVFRILIKQRDEITHSSDDDMIELVESLME